MSIEEFMKRVLILLVLLVGLGSQVQAKNDVPKCGKDTKIGDLCTINVRELHPTQFAVGMDEVWCRKKDLESMDQNELNDYLANSKRRVPIVRGLDNTFYLTDHHHLAVALYNARLKNPNQQLYAVLKEDFSNSKNPQEFWHKMRQHQPNPYVWLKDNTGISQPPTELPTQLQSMTDDPMRTLSAWVRDSCGYIKCDKHKCARNYKEVTCAPESTYFLELYWADYLRKVNGVKQAMGEHAECNNQNDLDKGTCVSEQYSKLVKAFPAAMQAVTSQEAKEALGEGYGYNAKAPKGISPPQDCSGD